MMSKVGESKVQIAFDIFSQSGRVVQWAEKRELCGVECVRVVSDSGDYYIPDTPDLEMFRDLCSVYVEGYSQ